ncbi:hypothetical protein E3N88_38440 [Mikania micrantha]|uniref:Integrase catalytic domain-containing protein n=1 Tax=Mikania micrantha TaxID=192012 RepID=A0A5N6LU16_9ASTR|nr:hypothetical protein E3N88_38440 [Mikania micrantha]
MLQFKYSNCDDPFALWKDLQQRFNHQKTVLLPAARDEWQNVTEEDVLEKTFGTFHASNAGLQMYLRVQGFKRYSDLNALLLVAEKNNEVLMKNHLARPTGSMALPEANDIRHNDAKTFKHTRGHGRGHGRGRFDKNRFNHPFKWNNNYNGRGRGRGRGSGRGLGRSQRANNYHNLQNENQQYKFENEVGDICGPIHPPCGPFRYFMVLIDASRRWSHVSLLSTRNMTFAKFLAQIIQLRAHFPNYTVNWVRLGNAGEFTSHAFNDYCMSIGIVVEHSVAHVHTQNGLAESLIKRLQLIARPLIMKTKLPVSIWGHAILHAGSLIHTRPSANHKYSPIQLASGQESNISHLRIFGCAVYVHIAPPQYTKMGPQRRLRSIIRYLEPLTCDVFTARFAYCHFDETNFPLLGGEKNIKEKNVSWCEHSLLYLDPRTKQCETEVQKIIHMQDITNQLPDAFTDTKRVTKSHIPAENAPARVEIPSKELDKDPTHESQRRLKHGRPIGSKDKNPRKRKGSEKERDHKENDSNEIQNIKTFPDEEMNDINREMSINYGHTNTLWNRYEMETIDEIFSYSVATRIKVHELREKSKSDLFAQLKDLKAELALLRVAKVTGGAPNKLSKIKVVRTGIAQVLTVISQTQKAKLREAYKNKKYLPLDLRPKKTRAIRRRLTKHQVSLKTEREKKKEKYFPLRKYAIKA